MKKKIKLIATDLDGTFLTTDNRITDYSKEVLSKAIAQGCEVVIASGRPISAIPKELLEFPGIRYAVSANGAKIMDLGENKIIYENLLSVETAKEVLDVFAQYDVIREVFIDGVAYMREEDLNRLEDYLPGAGVREYVLSTRVPVDNVEATLLECNCPVDKVHGFFRDMEEKKRVGEHLSKISGVEVTGAFNFTYEVNAADTSKKTALVVLGELLGIDPAEMMACGDGLNDYEMLRTVGFGVAMVNGNEDLKTIADYVAESNDSDGVAKAIERFVSN